MASLSAAIRTNRTLVIGGVCLYYVDIERCPSGTMECYFESLSPTCSILDAAPTNIPCSPSGGSTLPCLFRKGAEKEPAYSAPYNEGQMGCENVKSLASDTARVVCGKSMALQRADYEFARFVSVSIVHAWAQGRV